MLTLLETCLVEHDRPGRLVASEKPNELVPWHDIGFRIAFYAPEGVGVVSFQDNIVLTVHFSWTDDRYFNFGSLVSVLYTADDRCWEFVRVHDTFFGVCQARFIPSFLRTSEILSHFRFIFGFSFRILRQDNSSTIVHAGVLYFPSILANSIVGVFSRLGHLLYYEIIVSAQTVFHLTPIPSYSVLWFF